MPDADPPRRELDICAVIIHAKARRREPEGLFNLADVVDEAKKRCPPLHAMLLKLGDCPTSEAIATFLAGVIEEDGGACELRLAAVTLVAKAGGVFRGNRLVDRLEPEVADRVLAGLILALRDPEKEVRRAAVQAVAEFGRHDAHSQVVRALAVQLVAEAEADIVLLILQELQDYGRDLMAIAVPEICNLLKPNCDELVATTACKILALVGEMDANRLEVLVRVALANGSSLLREEAMRAVVAIKPSIDQLAPPVDRHGTREAAMHLLAHFGAKGRRLRLALAKLGAPDGRDGSQQSEAASQTQAEAISSQRSSLTGPTENQNRVLAVDQRQSEPEKQESIRVDSLKLTLTPGDYSATRDDRRTVPIKKGVPWKLLIRLARRIDGVTLEELIEDWPKIGRSQGQRANIEGYTSRLSDDLNKIGLDLPKVEGKYILTGAFPFF